MQEQIDRRVYNVENDLHLIKLAINKHSQQNEQILASLNELKLQFNSQRGFMAGVEKAGGLAIAIGAGILALLTFFFDHVFGKN
jgi:hypothetical protein